MKKTPKSRKITAENLTLEDITKFACKNGFKVKVSLPPARFEPFYMVQVEGGGEPTKRHTRHDEAFAEATRLAKKEQRKAYILQAVLCAEPQPIEVFYTQPHPPTKEEK
jgi:hypothetical protein